MIRVDTVSKVKKSYSFTCLDYVFSQEGEEGALLGTLAIEAEEVLLRNRKEKSLLKVATAVFTPTL